jgi:uncharacterized repeat protein (TIGR03803 family)
LPCDERVQVREADVRCLSAVRDGNLFTFVRIFLGGLIGALVLRGLLGVPDVTVAGQRQEYRNKWMSACDPIEVSSALSFAACQRWRCKRRFERMKPVPWCTDGEYPAGSLVQATNEDYYGTTSQGGADGGGTVFKITAGGTLTCSQSGCPDGDFPVAGLLGRFVETQTTSGSGGRLSRSWGPTWTVRPASHLTAPPQRSPLFRRL